MITIHLRGVTTIAAATVAFDHIITELGDDNSGIKAKMIAARADLRAAFDGYCHLNAALELEPA